MTRPTLAEALTALLSDTAADLEAAALDIDSGLASQNAHLKAVVLKTRAAQLRQALTAEEGAYTSAYAEGKRDGWADHVAAVDGVLEAVRATPDGAVFAPTSPNQPVAASFPSMWTIPEPSPIVSPHSAGVFPKPIQEGVHPRVLASADAADVPPAPQSVRYRIARAICDSIHRRGDFGMNTEAVMAERGEDFLKQADAVLWELSRQPVEGTETAQTERLTRDEPNPSPTPPSYGARVMGGLHKWGVYRKSEHREFDAWNSYRVVTIDLESHHHSKGAAEKRIPNGSGNYIVAMTSWYGHYAEARA